MGKRAVGMPRERHKTLLRAFGRLQRNRHMAEPSPTRLFKEPQCAFSTTSLSTVPERARFCHDALLWILSELSSKPANMPRSFLVDSLILRETSDKGTENNPPLFPYAVHSPHHPHGMPTSCHSRKAGLLCFCPLCMAASQLHPSPPTLPLLKASFPPFTTQYCHSALSRQHTASNGVNLSHAPGIYQAAYSVPDPRQFHCISIGEYKHFCTFQHA